MTASREITTSDSAPEPRISLADHNQDTDIIVRFADNKTSRDNVWIDINLPGDRPKAVLNIVCTDDGIVLDLYQEQDEDAEEADMEPVASTYAFDQDIVGASEAVKP